MARGAIIAGDTAGGAGKTILTGSWLFARNKRGMPESERAKKLCPLYAEKICALRGFWIQLWSILGK